MDIELTFNKTFEIPVCGESESVFWRWLQNCDSDIDFINLEEFDHFVSDLLAKPDDIKEAREALMKLNKIILQLEKEGFNIAEEYDFISFLEQEQ